MTDAQDTPEDALRNDGLMCNGKETCDAVMGWFVVAGCPDAG
ncbi:MAG: hypothetical protein AB2A00_32880 [Myxococcota bacterium]